MTDTQSSAERGIINLQIGFWELGWWKSIALIAAFIFAILGFPDGDVFDWIGVLIISAVRVFVFGLGGYLAFLSFDCLRVGFTGRKSRFFQRMEDPSSFKNRAGAIAFGVFMAWFAVLIGFLWIMRMGPWNIDKPMGIIGGKSWAAMIGCS
jgi:hypothetical protein